MRKSPRFFAAALVAALLLPLASPVPTSASAAEPARDANPDYSGAPAFDYGAEPVQYLQNDRVKLGIDLSIGGAVTYLEDFAAGSGNMINSADWGRQIQLSYYSGPVPYIGPNGEQPSGHWAGLGWNPIQSGDCGGVRSKTIAFERPDDKTMFVRTIPMQWPHKNVPGECVFECVYRLTPNGFTLDATILNNRSDKTQYSGRSQETPAVYTNARWYKLVSYLGKNPFANEPTTVIVDKADGKGWPWVNYYTPEHWSALVDDDNVGLGVYQPFSTRTTAGFSGGDANKGTDAGPKDGPTGYIAPLEQTILDWNIKRTYRATFIVGSLDEIRKTVYRLAKKDADARLDWRFKDDRQNWAYTGAATDTGFPIRGSLKVRFTADADCAARSPETFWRCADAPILEIDAAFADAKTEKTGDDARQDAAQSAAPVDAKLALRIERVSPADEVDYLGWSEGAKDAAKDRAEKAATHPSLADITVEVPIKFDGERRTASVDLSQIAEYAEENGAAKRLTVEFPRRNGEAKIYRIGFKAK